MFLIAQKVTFKEIEHKGMVGRAIALEFKRLRILSIHSWRSRFYEKI
ncbi:hypothetical protein HIC20_02975 [Buchnera aphidicola (Hormaphis cornu)]|nr:hypothetical protein HIC20_02975 [Buchnera aphidicola (Hormaphis cornu)]